jgi:prevent-host-death family protein
MHSSNIWQLQEAKNKLSQLIKQAQSGTHQVITLHGKTAAVILSADEYQQLIGNQSTLLEQLCVPILDEDEALFERSKESGRAFEL